MRERSRRPACVNNLRGLGTAVLLYTDSEGAAERFQCDASWNGQIAHRDGWNVWYLDSSVRWIRKDRKEARGITSMRREEWFEDVLLPDGMESELGKRRSPSVWRRFDACAGLAKLSEPRPVRLHRP